MVIFITSLFFGLIISRTSPSISAVYKHIENIDEGTAPAISPPIAISKGSLRHKNVNLHYTSYCSAFSSCLSTDTVLSSTDVFSNAQSISIELSDSPLESDAIINAVISIAPGFTAFEKLPPKQDSKREEFEISPEEIRIPSSYLSDEKAKVGYEYTVLVEHE